MRYLALFLAVFALAASAFATISISLPAGNGYNFTSDSQGNMSGGAWQVVYTGTPGIFGNFGQKTIYGMGTGVSFDSVLCPQYGAPNTTNYTFNTTTVAGLEKYCVYINLNNSYIVLNVTSVNPGNISFDWRWASAEGGSPPGGNGNNVSVHGWVAKQDAAPVSNFTLHFQLTGDCGQYGCPGEMATTDGSGYYYKTGLQPGNYTVDGWGPNMPGLPTNPINNGSGGSYLANNTNYTYNITVQDFGNGPQGPSGSCGGNGTISGYVKNATGDAISGIMVSANTMMGMGPMEGQGEPGMGSPGGMNNFCGTSGTSGSNGSYSLSNMKNGTYMVFAYDPNGTYSNEEMSFESGGIQLANDSSTAVHNITMEKGGRVFGVLYNNATGDCNASNLTDCPKAGNVFINAIKPTCATQPGPDCFGGGTMSDWSNGSFSLNIKPGNYTVSVEANSFLQLGGATIGTFEVNASDAIDVGNITLSQGRKMTGYVLDGAGNPITGTWISIMVRQAMGPGQQSGFSGPPMYGDINQSSGQYNVFGIRSGTWDIEVMPDFQSSYSRKVIPNVVIDNSSANVAMNISLTSGASISGWVNCSGIPVANGWISAQDQSSNKFASGGFDTTSFMGASIYNGNYSIRGLKPGIYEMHMDLPGSSCAPESAFDVQVADAAVTRNFSLSGGYTLSGRVSSGASGVPWAFINAFIPPTQPNQPPAGFGFGQTDQNGDYTINGLRNGTYKVRAEPPYGSGFSAGMGDITMDDNKVLNFTLGSGGSLRGRVVDSSGNAVQFVGVNAFSRTAFSFGFSGTSQSGEFTITGLSPANDYYITVFPPPGAAYGKLSGSVGPKSVSNGTTNVGDIALSAANGTITGRVLNGAANASGARVHAWAMGQPSWGEATTGIDGTFNITGLSNGAHDLMVELSGFPPEFASVAVNGSSTPDTNITFNATQPRTLSGYVNDSTGSLLANVTVNVWNETLRTGETATTDGSGYYSMTLKNGSYNIGAFKPSYQFNKSTVTVANGTDAEQNLTLSALSQMFASLYNVSGHIVSSTGENAVYNRTAVLAERNEATSNPFILDTITDASGAFAFYNVPPRNYTLVGIIPPNSTYAINITVTNANVLDQNLTFT